MIDKIIRYLVALRRLIISLSKKRNDFHICYPLEDHSYNISAIQQDMDEILNLLERRDRHEEQIEMIEEEICRKQFQATIHHGITFHKPKHR